MKKKSKSWIYRRFSLIFLPATSLMMRLNFTRRTIVIGVITILAFSIISNHLYIRLNTVIETSEKELVGLNILKPLFRTVQLIQQHRGLSAGVLGGTVTLKEQRQSKQKQAEDVFNIFAEASILKNIDSNEWENITTEWNLLLAHGMTWTVRENFSKHTEIIDQLLLLGQAIADFYSLTNHPDLDTYYLLNTTIHELASAQEFLGQTRAFGTGILAEKKSSEQQKVQISTLVSQAEKAIHWLRHNLRKTARYNPSIEQALILSSQETFKNFQNIYELVKSDILHEHYQTSPEEFFYIMTIAIDKTYNTMYQVLFPTTEDLIKKQRLKAEQILITSAVIIFLAFLMILYFSVGIYIATVKSIDSIAKTTLAFAKGDLSSRLHINSISELNTLAKSFNHMADELTRLINAEKEDKARINSIIDSAHDALVQINVKNEIKLPPAKPVVY